MVRTLAAALSILFSPLPEAVAGDPAPVMYVYSGTPGTCVVFSPRASGYVGPRAPEYRWEFGDGSQASGAVVTHVYEHAGIFSSTLTVVSEVGREPETFLSPVEVRDGRPDRYNVLFRNIDSYRIVFLGVVERYETVYPGGPSAACASPGCTLLRVGVEEYLIGDGPNAVQVKVESVDSPQVETVTYKLGAHRLPKVGDRAIFWIAYTRGTARVTSPLQVWPIADRVVMEFAAQHGGDPRGTVEEIVESIRRIADLASVSTQRLAASSLVLASYDALLSDCDQAGSVVYDCHDVRVWDQIGGRPLGVSSIRIRTARSDHPKLRRRWGDARGVLLIAEDMAPTGEHLPTHPVLGFLRQHSGAYTIGYRLVTDDPADRIEAITVELGDLQ